MKYHVHHGPYGSRGESRPVEYRDEQNRPIAGYSKSEAWAGSPAMDWVTLYSRPNVPHIKRIPHIEGRAEAICEAWVKELGFEHDEARDSWDHRSMCD